MGYWLGLLLICDVVLVDGEFSDDLLPHCIVRLQGFSQQHLLPTGVLLYVERGIVRINHIAWK